MEGLPFFNRKGGGEDGSTEERWNWGREGRRNPGYKINELIAKNSKR